MKETCLSYAMDVATLISKLWHDLIATNALGNDFGSSGALGITMEEHGWVAPWDPKQAATAFQSA